ncbi:MAG TPA: DUF4340 domain-containing protein [Methylothermaceae bacterium]|nr:DUF4340 domain-containing protein [Methylothermaceae bacterium]
MVGGWRSIIVLLVLVAGLGAWVAWLQSRPEPEEPKLADLDPQAIGRITVRYEDRMLRFRRQGDGWQMQQPLTAPADSYRIEQILQLPQATSHGRYAIPESDRSRFGLAPPKAEIELDGHTFRFGQQNPIDFRRYVQLDDGPVHLIDDTLFHLLSSPASDWLDTRLLPATASVRGLQLPGWRVRMSEKGGWRSEPEVDPARLQRWIDAWQNARAIRVSLHEGPIPKDKPAARIQLADETLTFIILAQEPELVLLRPDLKLKYHFYSQIGARLLHPPGQQENQDS